MEKESEKNKQEKKETETRRKIEKNTAVSCLTHHLFSPVLICATSAQCIFRQAKTTQVQQNTQIPPWTHIDAKAPPHHILQSNLQQPKVSSVCFYVKPRVFTETQCIRDGRDNKGWDKKGTTKGKENIVLSPSIPTNFIQRILGEYRDDFLYF